MDNLNDSIEVINIAAEVYSQMWTPPGEQTVAERISLSREITKIWQDSVLRTGADGNRYQKEVPVDHKALRARIDLVDSSTLTAYELKVSPGNHTDEFLRDIFKICAYNEDKLPSEKISRFIFITQESSADYLKRGLPKYAWNKAAESLGLEIDVHGIKPCTSIKS